MTGRPGCQACNRGWLGYNPEGQIIACPNCRPHAIAYLEQHGRGTPTPPGLIHRPNARTTSTPQEASGSHHSPEHPEPATGPQPLQTILLEGNLRPRDNKPTHQVP